jgi:hypothetical protein
MESGKRPNFLVPRPRASATKRQNSQASMSLIHRKAHKHSASKRSNEQQQDKHAKTKMSIKLMHEHPRGRTYFKHEYGEI